MIQISCAELLSCPILWRHFVYFLFRDIEPLSTNYVIHKCSTYIAWVDDIDDMITDALHNPPNKHRIVQTLGVHGQIQK
jgi:hypothetical protein